MAVVSTYSRRAFAAMMLSSTAACGAFRRKPPASNPLPEELPSFMDGYGPLLDAGFNLPGIPDIYLQGINRRMVGTYLGEAEPGSIDVDPYSKFLYHVKEDGTAVRYPVGVGRQGRTLSGRHTVQFKRAWPGWTPTQNMLRTEPEVYGPFRGGVPGGLASPLGARALYIYRNGRDSFYRIHGTNDLASIGNSGSAGCIRMFNQDIIHLFNAIETPMPINIRSEEEALRVDPENFNRGVELPPTILTEEELFGPEGREGLQAPDLDQLAEL